MNVVKLNNGNCLIKDYGKYGSGLVFISDKETIKWNKKSFPFGEYEALEGKFFISKKGNACFDLTKSGHYLLKENGGRSFGEISGNSLLKMNEIRNGLYFKRAISNGGGQWTNYMVITPDYEPIEEASKHTEIEYTDKDIIIVLPYMGMDNDKIKQILIDNGYNIISEFNGIKNEFIYDKNLVYVFHFEFLDKAVEFKNKGYKILVICKDSESIMDKFKIIQL